MLTVTTTSRIFVIIPGPPDLAALLNDDEVSTVVAAYHIDRGAYPYRF